MNRDDLEREAEEETEYVSNLELTIDKIGMGGPFRYYHNCQYPAAALKQ